VRLDIDSSKPPPKEPEPVADGAKAEDIKKYETETEKYLEWIAVDEEVKHWIHATTPEFITVKHLNCATSADLWKAICTVHEGKTKTFRMDMIRRIHNERCTDADDVRDHFVKMVRLREELAATGEALDDDNFASILTNSLPESYGNVISTAYTVSAITGSTPTIDQIIAVVETEYSRRQISNGSLPGSIALFSNQPKPSSSKKKPKHKPVCTNTKCRFRHNHMGGDVITKERTGVENDEVSPTGTGRILHRDVDQDSLHKQGAPPLETICDTT